LQVWLAVLVRCYMPDGHLPKPTLSPGREIINLELKGPIDGAKPQVLFNSRSSSLRVSSITLVSTAIYLRYGFRFRRWGTAGRSGIRFARPWQSCYVGLSAVNSFKLTCLATAGGRPMATWNAHCRVLNARITR